MAKSKNESINISIFTALKVSEKSGVPVLIMSNPGLGKSTTVSMFAEVRGYHLQLLRGNSTTAEEVLGYDVADQSEGSRTTKHLRPSWYTRILEKKEEGTKTLLFLDEITTANDYVQAALLHLIFERMVGDEKLPDDTLIVSAGNYAQNLSNQMTLLPPLMNRFMIFNIIPDHTDLDTFLCKYEGSIASPTGERKNYIKTIKDKMAALDAQEVVVPDDQKNKIGEYIERGIRETTKFLMTSGSKPVDLGVMDLQNIYSDTDSDKKLLGFVTLRTLNYLRDVTVASFLCFGKSGITSDNYRNMIDGLCGLGVSRDSKKEVVKTYIGKDYYDCMTNIVNEIEKMKNDRLPAYEKFFREVLSGKKSFDIPEMQAIINKIAELKADKDLENIERPIDPAIVEELCKLTKSSGTNIVKTDIKISENISVSISPETLMGYVNFWNILAKLLTSVESLVSDPKNNYKSNTASAVKKVQTDLRPQGIKLRSIRKALQSENADIVNIVPIVESFS